MDTRYKTIGGEICQNCGKRHKLCWKAPDAIWLKTTGQKKGVLCITCFDAIAAANGIALAWECHHHPIYYKTTPTSDVYKTMEDIIKDIPSTGEYETDARDVWPERWAELKNRVRG